MPKVHIGYIPFFNQVALAGAVFSDPILRSFDVEGQEKPFDVCNFILVSAHPTNRRRRLSIPVVVARNAEYVYSRLQFGDPVVVAGELRSEEAKKTEGQTKRRWEYRLWASRVTKLYRPKPGEVMDFSVD